MALQRDTRYPGRWSTGDAAHPQGAFKNRTAPGSLDGSYIEQDWANDWDGYFAALMGAAGLTANGIVDTATASQYFTALQTMIDRNGHGQCQLFVSNVTTLGLRQSGGRNLIINGVSRQVPSAGVTITNAGLSANTFYYVYAFMSGATMLLEFSTTTHVTHTNGVEIKTGDPSRTLVGAAYTDASTQFVRNQTFIGVITWFNRQSLGLALTATTTAFTNVSIAEITASDRLSFITWADEGVTVSANGTMNLSAVATVAFNIYVNNVINRLTNSGASGTAGQNVNSCMAGNISVNEGVLNTTTVFASTTAGTVTAAFANFVNLRG